MYRKSTKGSLSSTVDGAVTVIFEFPFSFLFLFFCYPLILPSLTRPIEGNNMTTTLPTLPNSPTGGTSSRREYQPVFMRLEDDPLSYTDHYTESTPEDASLRIFLSSSILSLGLSFWLLGLFNNSSYVIMIASAKVISEGGTALVFFANILPSLSIKLSAPYWFHRVSYRARIQIATMCMVASFALVAITRGIITRRYESQYPDNDDADIPKTPIGMMIIQLLGVAFGSAQCGLGEASLLALAGKIDTSAPSASSSLDTTDPDATTPGTPENAQSTKGHCLTAFSSGTGMAGVFGFFWKWLWTEFFGFTLSTTLWLAMSLAVGYWWCFQQVNQYLGVHVPSYGLESVAMNISEEPMETRVPDDEDIPENSEERDGSTSINSSEISAMERFKLVLALWPYMIPLFLVYAAEYALQSGTWTAIGFPVESVSSRNTFYEYSNWMYQAGVFVSRSSGTIFTAPMWVLWLMPALQVVNLVMFSYVAARPSLPAYNPFLLYTGALYTGILGGAVYIHCYKRICMDIFPVERREFSLSATSVAESIGVLVADSIGFVLQACLYEANGLDGAMISCPV